MSFCTVSSFQTDHGWIPLRSENYFLKKKKNPSCRLPLLLGNYMWRLLFFMLWPCPVHTLTRSDIRGDWYQHRTDQRPAASLPGKIKWFIILWSGYCKRLEQKTFSFLGIVSHVEGKHVGVYCPQLPLCKDKTSDFKDGKITYYTVTSCALLQVVFTYL